MEELKRISSINYNNFIIFIQGGKLKYKKPKFSEQSCISNEKTFSISIYVPIEIWYKSIRLFENKYVLLGNVGLLNEKGTFLINGNTRIIVNQITRSPGIYFQKLNNKKVFTSTIIPEKGNWFTIKINLWLTFLLF
jgi:DNA-directed RNA polymerase subunit beta